MKIEVELRGDVSHMMAVAWHWEGVEGCTMIGPPDAKPTIVIEITELERCPAGEQ